MARNTTKADGAAAPVMHGGRVTMKDMAASLGVSVNTVHKAIAGKSGVSEKTRAKILAYAEQCGYRRNESASSLRRKDANVIVCLPSSSGSGRYYYAYAWEGCRRFMEESRDTGMRFECVEYPIGSPLHCLEGILEHVNGGGHVDGMVSVAPTSSAESHALHALAESGVAVELLDGNAADTGRLGSVVADYTAAGHLMAEQACNFVHGRPEGARVLLLSGGPYVDSHYLVARAFHEYMQEYLPSAEVEDFAGAHAQADALRARLVERLRSDVPHVACSVFAAGSEVLSSALVEAGCVGEVMAIGSDLFPESILALRRGIFANVVYKDPAGLAYRAMEALSQYLLWGTRPATELEVFPVELVFRSNLRHYCGELGTIPA